MAEQGTFIGNLLARRVPQILGLYVGAAWLTVEMGEWVTDQLGLPGGWVLYVFLVLVVMLPSVVLLAWNHGQPGRDRWTRGEKIGLPLNGLLAAVVVTALIVGEGPVPTSPTVYAGSAVVERTLVDETGQEQTFAVAREGFHRRIATFFWSQEDAAGDGADASWESYAIAWLLNIDLGRNPLLSVLTPYSGDWIDELRSAGFEDAVGEPLSLALSLAREADVEQIIRGRFDRSDGEFRLQAEVVDVETGRIVVEHEARGESLVAAVSSLTDAVSRELFDGIERDAASFVDIRLQEASSASVEALEVMVRSFNAYHFDRDTELALESVRRAIEIDPEFALAYARLYSLLRANGQFDAAAAAIDRALALDYKLDSELVFGLKANRYAVLGDYDKAIRVLEMWTEVHPDSLQAQVTLANNLITIGRLDDAATAIQAAREIDPDDPSLDRLRFNLEKLRGNYDEAAQRLQSYIESEPQDSAARLELGSLYLLQGMFDRARRVLEDAQMVASDPFAAELQLMLLDARSGRLPEVLSDTAAALERLDRPNERSQVLMVRYRALSSAGRFNDLLDLLASNQETLTEAMPSMNVWMLVAQIRSEAYQALGRPDDAMAALEAAESRVGDPMARYMAFHRLEVLAEFSGDPDEMARQLERFRFFKTNFSYSGMQAYLRFAEALMAASQDRTGEAVERMRAAAQALRGSGVALDFYALDGFDFALARMLAEDGSNAEARSVIDDLLERHPAFGEARLLLARLHEADGRIDEARAQLDRLLQQWEGADPDYLAYQEALALRAGLDSEVAATTP